MRLCPGDKNLLLQNILVTVVMIDADPALSFMQSPVHISRKNKIDVSLLADTDNLDVMLLPDVPEVAPLVSSEAEYPDQLSVLREPRPQLSLLFKGNYADILVRHIIDVA